MQTDVYSRLESLEFSGIKLGLQPIQIVLEYLGNPETSFSSLLIAGTNGKGSVGAMLEEILCRHGVKTGYYISPHLVDVRERIRVDGKKISSTDFENVLGFVFQAIDRLIETGSLDFPLTYFETLTASAFYHFHQTGVEWAVVEVGLGGRLDATNTLNQNLSIITTIDLDHVQYLGATLEEVAAEKAGILKQNRPVVVGPVPEGARRVIEAVAQHKGSPVTQFDPASVSRFTLREGFPVFHYKPWRRDVRVGLRGAHQAGNAAIALLACDQLFSMGLMMDRTKIVHALDHVRWPGRLDLISKTPEVMVDCAHNVHAVRALDEFLKNMGWNRVIALFAAMKDKDVKAMLSSIGSRIEVAVLTRVSPLQRCASLEALSHACLEIGIPASMEPDVIVAYRNAFQKAREESIPLVVFGSIYLVGAVLKIHDRQHS